MNLSPIPPRANRPINLAAILWRVHQTRRRTSRKEENSIRARRSLAGRAGLGSASGGKSRKTRSYHLSAASSRVEQLTSRLNCPAKCCYTPAHMEHRDDQRFRARRPSLGAILLGLIPFTAACFSVPLWDRVYPMVVGLPFNFFWLILWLLLTPLCMWGAYRLEAGHASEPRHKDGGTL